MLKLYDGKTRNFNTEPSDIIQNVYDAKVEFDKGYMLTFKLSLTTKEFTKRLKMKW